MAKRLLAAGFDARDMKVLGPNDRKGNLVVRYRGTDSAGLKPILIIGHLDVVEARREDWTTDPFQFIEKDGYFYGRGTQDMKVNDAILVTTFIRFKREGYQPNRDIILALTADEEGGKSNGVDWLLKNHRDLVDAAFALESGRGRRYHGEGQAAECRCGSEREAIRRLRNWTPPTRAATVRCPFPTMRSTISRTLSRAWSMHRFPIELNPITRTYFERRAALESGQIAPI